MLQLQKLNKFLTTNNSTNSKLPYCLISSFQLYNYNNYFRLIHTVEARELRVNEYFILDSPKDKTLYRVQSIDPVARGRGGTYYKFTLLDCINNKPNHKLTLSPSDKCAFYAKHEAAEYLQTNQKPNNKSSNRSTTIGSYDEKISMNLLYLSDNNNIIHLMHPTTFEQLDINLNDQQYSNIAITNSEQLNNLPENSTVTIYKNDGKIIGIGV